MQKMIKYGSLFISFSAKKSACDKLGNEIDNAIPCQNEPSCKAFFIVMDTHVALTAVVDTKGGRSW